MEAQTQPQQSSSGNNKLFVVVFVISVLLTAVIAGSVVYFWQRSANEKTISRLAKKISLLEERISTIGGGELIPQPTSSSALSPTLIINSTTDWKVYKNEKYGFSFKYFPELSIRELQRESSSAMLSLYITNDNNLGLFYGKPENSIKDIYFALTIEIFKDMDKEKIIAEWFDIICNSPWQTDPASCKQEKIKAFKSYNQNGIQGHTADITPYEQSFTYLIINHDPYILFTVLGGTEGTFPTNNAINLRDQILSTFKFTD